MAPEVGLERCIFLITRYLYRVNHIKSSELLHYFYEQFSARLLTVLLTPEKAKNDFKSWSP